MRLDETCCSYLGRNFLISINLLSAVVGLLLCAGGAYLWIEYENQFQELLSTGPILGVMIAGFALFVLTMFGIYGAVTGKRTVLITYLVFVIVLIALEVAASIIFLQYLDFIDSSEGSESSELQDQTEIAINNFIYKSYQTCCVRDGKNCGAFIADVDPIYCTPVSFCANLNATMTKACIIDTSAEPSDSIELGVCTAFAQFKTDGNPLVGPAEAGNKVTCGGGVPENFEVAVTAWLKNNIEFFGYGALAIGILEVFIVGFALVLVLTRPHLVPKAEVLDDDDVSVDANRVSVAIPIQSVRSSMRSSVRTTHSNNSNRHSYRSDKR